MTLQHNVHNGSITTINAIVTKLHDSHPSSIFPLLLFTIWKENSPNCIILFNIDRIKKPLFTSNQEQQHGNAYLLNKSENIRDSQKSSFLQG